MKSDKGKTREQLMSELENLRQRVAESEALEAERKRAELEYKAMIQATIDGFWLVDMQGRFLDVNDAYCRLIGYSRDELLKMSIPDIEAIEKPEETAARIAKIRKVGGDRFETRHRRKDGRIVDVEISVNYIEVAGGRMFVFIRDITERKQAEEALYESEEMHRALMELGGRVGEAIIMRQDTKQGEGTHVFVSDEWCCITGYSKKELLSMSFFDLVHPGYREESLARYRRRMRGENLPGLFEISIVRKDGTEVPIELTSAFTTYKGKVATVAFVRDITERKKAEEALHESEERYRAIVNLGGEVGEAIIMRQDTDQGEGIMSFVSDEWCRITGYSKEELLGISFFDLLHPKDREASQARYRKRMRGESLPGLFELCIVRKDGTEVPIELTSACTTYLGKRANVAFIRDITERKKAEIEREKLIKDLEGSLEKIQTLHGLLPICAWCKKIRDDKGYWMAVETYIGEHTKTLFSHSICPQCAAKRLAGKEGRKNAGAR